MIILDDDEEQLPKLASPPPVYTLVRLPRVSSPAPSLLDYESSQKLHKLGKWKRRALTRRWRWAIYGLIAYFVITVAIGVPLIVVVSLYRHTTPGVYSIFWLVSCRRLGRVAQCTRTQASSIHRHSMAPQIVLFLASTSTQGLCP